MEAIETVERVGLTATLHPEEYIDDFYNPRQFDGNLGTMLCWHPRYTLGDEQFDSPEDVGGARSMEEVAAYLRAEKDAVHIHALYLYDHSGISISCRNFADTIDPGGWDTTAIGFIYTTKAKIAELVDGSRGTSAPADKVDEFLVGEVKEYDKYLRGEVYHYVIEDEDGDHVDGCGGYLGYEYALEAMQEALEAAVVAAGREAQEREEMAARDIVTK